MISPTLLLLLGIAVAGDDQLDDYESLPRYLTQPRVLEGLQASTGPLGACFADAQAPAPATAVQVVMAIAEEGQVSHVRAGLEPHDVTRQACVTQALCELSFADHDESWERWSFQLAFSQGEVFLLPGLQQVPRPRTPLFVQLPEPQDQELRQLLDHALGAALEPTPLQGQLPRCEPPSPATPPAPEAAAGAP